ncbi:uncharacterized protein FFB20_03972 [Fusarium fujikuroi]|nr:uncharacterized protein FFB20_03972 [Fusarium fujikuroi]SCN89138.1 uncharacterized protein FFE2_06631 [Fusarium fujikuroi]SCO17902.1 uncharacterized protein FFC1_13084 [Fusarium fujikuroi]SCO38158.1 uncharacterized protein FFMR_04963 [Fusarium fujikuroi]SCO43192.1 uncharacterized protein FFNC_08827 [Fusarium fujikuroi]
MKQYIEWIISIVILPIAN